MLANRCRFACDANKHLFVSEIIVNDTMYKLLFFVIHVKRIALKIVLAWNTAVISCN